MCRYDARIAAAATSVWVADAAPTTPLASGNRKAGSQQQPFAFKQPFSVVRNKSMGTSEGNSVTPKFKRSSDPDRKQVSWLNIQSPYGYAIVLKYSWSSEVWEFHQFLGAATQVVQCHLSAASGRAHNTSGRKMTFVFLAYKWSPQMRPKRTSCKQIFGFVTVEKALHTNHCSHVLSELCIIYLNVSLISPKACSKSRQGSSGA